VYRINDDLALVQTVDFFTPVVDDPFTFGQIAAANSLSDIYAMGGKPISALSLVGFPEKGDPAILEQIIRGGLDKMKEANCTVIGGHSIRNDDIQFGYAVTGTIHPKRIWRNVGAQANDVILLTKAIGTGLISTALKRERAGKASLDAAVASMSQLNRAAAEALHEFAGKTNSHAIHAVTDVTGFGVLGHAREIALGDPEKGIPTVTIEIQHKAIPVLPGAFDAARQGMIAGGLNNNLDFLRACVTFGAGVPEENRALLFDPQTSGGLLVAISADVADVAIEILQRHQIAAAKIGRVLPKGVTLLSVT
jgi:selenide,water dikinase